MLALLQALSKIWNGFASIWRRDRFTIELPEDIRFDLSRDLLYLRVSCVADFQHIFKVPGRDWPRILKETQVFAITGEDFVKLGKG